MKIEMKTADRLRSLPVIGLLALLSVFSTGGLCGPSPPGPPTPDACSDADARTADSLDITPDSGDFTPYADGDVVHPIYGGQGSQMLVVRLLMMGASPPECLHQHTKIMNRQNNVIAESTVPVKTYAVSAGRRRTGSLFLPGYFSRGERITVTVEAAGRTLARTLSIDTPATPCNQRYACYETCAASMSGCGFNCGITLGSLLFQLDDCVQRSCPSTDGGTADCRWSRRVVACGMCGGDCGPDGGASTADGGAMTPDGGVDCTAQDKQLYDACSMYYLACIKDQ